MVGKRKKSIRKENYMISRGDGGYLVRKTIRRKVKQVFFGDKKYGGKDKARAAAVDYRDKLLIKMSNEIVFQTNLNNKTTGVVGVSLAANMNRHRNVAVINLRAQAPSAEELKFTSFSAKLHGLWGAYSSAVDFRSRHIFPYTGVSIDPKETFEIFLNHYIDKMMESNDPIIKNEMLTVVLAVGGFKDVPPDVISIVQGVLRKRDIKYSV
jgi:hypothetical protein